MSKFNQQAMSAALTEYEEVYGNPDRFVGDSGSNSSIPPHAQHHKVGGNVNHEGGTAFDHTDPMALYTLVCTMAIQDKFYESTSDQMKRLIALIKGNDPMFVARLAVYARTKMYLRSVPIVLIVELAKIHRGDDLISRMIERVLIRADEICNLLKYYQTANHRTGTKKLASLSNQIKKGVRTAFEDGRFDEYQFAKYNRDGEVKLRDAIFLTHPKPQSPEQKILFDKIVNNTLEVPYTWETQMSAGDKPKNEIWNEMIASGRMGYMAMLRNLRNFITTGVSPHMMGKVCEIIADPDNVRKSKQLPFRFLSAYRSLVSAESRWGSESTGIPTEVTESSYIPMLTDALEGAISVSVERIPMFNDGRVLVATDVSGSMMSKISPKGVIEQFDIGALMAMMVAKAQGNAVSGMFGDDFKVLSNNPNRILQNTLDIRRREGEVGYSTNGYKVLQFALGQPEPFQHIMLFTDCQLYATGEGEWGHRSMDSDIQGQWSKYHNQHPTSKLYIFDLSGYGTTPVKKLGKNVFTIAGWSEKCFDILDRIQNGKDALDEINSIMV